MSARSDSEALIAGMLGPQEPEITCEECFGALDQYVEAELSGSPSEAELRIPGMRAHLQGCPACNEDHESLLAFLVEQGTTAGS